MDTFQPEHIEQIPLSSFHASNNMPEAAGGAHTDTLQSIMSEKPLIVPCSIPCKNEHRVATLADSQPQIYICLDQLQSPILPSLNRLRISQRNPTERGDGYTIGPEALHETERVLRAYADHCVVAGYFGDIRNGIQLEKISSASRLCLILDILEQRHLLAMFLRAQILDDSLPITLAKLHDLFEPCDNRNAIVDLFFAEQFRAFPRKWVKNCEIQCERREPLPIRSLKPLGHGTQAMVDKVTIVTNHIICARKQWINPNKDARKRFSQEVTVIKRLDPAYHIVEVFGTYTRGRELGLLLLPVADCDLWQALTMPEHERNELLSDNDLSRAMGCLCVGLAHIHQRGVRHKDIKPHNILIHKSRIVFADFGLSRDISNLSTSKSDGDDRGTPKYRAPELTDWGMRGRAADVFSLACVLLEIWSVLSGWATDEGGSFSSLSPFHQNLEQVRRWIHDYYGSSSSPFDRFWLKTCLAMLRKEPKDRPQIGQIIEGLEELQQNCRKEFLDRGLCETCQTRLARSSGQCIDREENNGSFRKALGSRRLPKTDERITRMRSSC